MTSQKEKLPIAVSQMDNNRLISQPIEDEMKQSYLDYAMSVIVARALPDVRDGLKPVHRRILYAMWDIGLKPGAKFRKSATVVGEVLGKYHPHGDVAVYDSLVRLAQPFAMRQVLVAGQGNFGSIDGDSAAAMRYTEAKLASISEELLLDIEKNTVNFLPNYDGSTNEPQVLPARLPNLLLNGTMGIAVGMATSIPPHNLGEIISAIQYLIEKPEADLDDLMTFVQGPDFPTGGAIFNKEDIKQAYATGKGSVVMRAKADIEELKSGFAIIVTELSYQVNKSELVMRIAELVKDKKIEGIKDLRDESDKDGIRVVVELKKDAYPKKVLNQLYKHTALQTSFHFNMLALVDGLQPRVLTLKTILEEYLKHRQEVVRRRAEFDLNKAQDRAHILEGLVMALEDIDKIIATIKKSKDKEDAKKNLIAKFKLSDKQADAILEMRLQQLANLERLRVEEELKEKKKLIKDLKELLASPKKILGVIKDELAQIKDKYVTDRLTKVYAGAVDKFTQEDLIPNEATVVIITKDGYLKRLAPDTFKAQGRGGKGVIGLTAKEEDSVEQLFSTTTHADLLFFTTRGRVFELKAYDVPVGSRTAKGQAVVNFLQLAPEEKVSEVLSLTDWAGYKYLIMVTRQGVIKKVAIDAFSNVRRSGLIAINLKSGDSLLWVKPSTGEDDIMLVTAKGQSIRFKEKGVRPMGRTAAGVRGIRIKSGDEVTGMDLINEGRPGPDEQLLVVMANGYGKRTKLREYKVQGRGGSGIKTANITSKTGQIMSAFVVNAKREQEDLIVMSNNGQVIRLALKAVSVLGRATQGVRIMRFKAEKDQVASVAFV
ncbi:MAG: DNA gyrase subunit A [Patescibacteria group bacterium]